MDTPRTKRPMRKCASTPILRVPDDSAPGNLEVYVVMRSFNEWAGGFFTKLPNHLRDGVRDLGICHYMTVFKHPDGSLVQFDFGPEGNRDIHVPHGPLASILLNNNNNNSKHKAIQRRSRHVMGEIREHILITLPDSHMFVGHTALTLDDIRAWSEVRAQQHYELHNNDCRHFVNSLVQYSTGVKSAASSCLRHQWQKNRDKYGIAGQVVRFGQWFTDVANWNHVKKIGQAAGTSIAAFSGHAALSKTAAHAALLAPMRRAIIQKPIVTAGTAAVATFAAGSGTGAVGGPVMALQEAGNAGARLTSQLGINAIRAVTSAAEHLGRAAGTASRSTVHATAMLNHTVTVVRKGAAGLMASKTKAPARVALPAATAPMGCPVRAPPAAPMIAGGKGGSLALQVVGRGGR